MTQQRRQERQAVMDDLLAQDWNVFGTLKFVNGRTIGRHSADKLLRLYWNRVDRVFFGKSAERQNLRIPRWCFAHEGSDSENFHVHFALLSPLSDVEHACCVLNAMWAQLHTQTAPLAKNWVMPVTDRSAVAQYLTKEYWRLGGKTVLDALCWNQTSADAMAHYEHEAQNARISRAASPFWLSQAQQALKTQQANY
jgi:hypothetical protein